MRRSAYNNRQIWSPLTDILWAKDLALHTEYLRKLTVVSPEVHGDPAEFDVPLNVEPFLNITFVGLPTSQSHLEAIVNFPKTVRKMWAAVSTNALIHAGFGMWPISEGLFACPIAKMQRKFLITNVESSSWRLSNIDKRRRDRVRAVVLERLNRLCVRSADLRFFTTLEYLNEFLSSNVSNRIRRSGHLD